MLRRFDFGMYQKDGLHRILRWIDAVLLVIENAVGEIENFFIICVLFIIGWFIELFTGGCNMKTIQIHLNGAMFKIHPETHAECITGKRPVILTVDNQIGIIVVGRNSIKIAAWYNHFTERADLSWQTEHILHRIHIMHMLVIDSPTAAFGL